jgi:hypothetical protein
VTIFVSAATLRRADPADSADPAGDFVIMAASAVLAQATTSTAATPPVRILPQEFGDRKRMNSLPR